MSSLPFRQLMVDFENHDGGDEDRRSLVPDGETGWLDQILAMSGVKTGDQNSDVVRRLLERPEPERIPDVTPYGRHERAEYERHMGPIAQTVVVQNAPLRRRYELPLYRPQWHYTCHGCRHAYANCDYVYDDYNTDGDCLAMK